MRWEDIKRLNEVFVKVKEGDFDVSNLIEVHRILSCHQDPPMDINEFTNLLEEAEVDHVIATVFTDSPKHEYWVWHPITVEFMANQGVVLVNSWFTEQPNISIRMRDLKLKKRIKGDGSYFPCKNPIPPPPPEKG